MLYHYTDRLSGAEIRHAGIIRATPITLHRDMFGADKGLQTKPIVWLTVNPIFEGTVVSKLFASGWPRKLIGDIWRIGVADDYQCQPLDDYTASAGIDHDWWDWTIRTGKMVQSFAADWRICDRDIPAADWRVVEVLRNITADNDTIWGPA